MWEMQVLIDNMKTCKQEWVSVKPSADDGLTHHQVNIPPYRYETKEEAINMLRHLYPNVPPHRLQVKYV